MKHSAGLLVYRTNGQKVEVLLVHPGGPLWAKKDSWSLPKGELNEGEEFLAAAHREFREETGLRPPKGKLIYLGSAKQNSTKTVYIWAVEGDIDLKNFISNSFSIEWPPHSGSQQYFPENSHAAWFDLAIAPQKLFKAQAIFAERLIDHLHLEPTVTVQQQKLL